jgi:hypothetical protein
MGGAGFEPRNSYVTKTITQAAFDGGDTSLTIDCWDATQVWARTSGSFVASYIPEVTAAGVADNLWTKVDIWELETRRIFSTTTGGKVFTFTDLLGAATARVRLTSMGPASGPITIELRTLHSQPDHGRGFPEPEIALTAFGNPTAPAAGATIAEITNPGEGTYSVTVFAYLTGSGTPAAAEDANLELVIPGMTNIRLPLVRAVNVPCVQNFKYLETNSAAADITVKAIGTGTASVIYNVHLTAQRLI